MFFCIPLKIELNMDDTGSSQYHDIDYVEKEFQKALELHDTGNFDQAGSLYKNLLRLYPLNSLILNSYGTLLYQQGNLFQMDIEL